MGNIFEKVQEMLNSYKEQLPDAEEEWPPNVQRALAFIIAHLFDPRLTVGWMRQECRINGHNFSSRFKYFLSKTPKQYMLHHRIEAAKNLLANPLLKDVSIFAIVYELGFSKTSTFSKCFKRVTSMSPSQWRKKQFDG